MKLLVVGCGSIGRRHAGNAAAHGTVGIVDFDSARAKDVATSLSIRAFDDLDTGLRWQPDGVIVAVPHDQHLPVAVRAVEAGCHVLIEKPISNGQEGLTAFLDRADALDRKVRVVCNMRFHPGPATLKQAVPRIGRVLFARAQYGNYLPDMRPGADYRELYCARAKAGGGVILDAIHEIDYVTWLLGETETVACGAGRLSDMDIDVEDYAAIALRHRGGARSEIHLDYLQRAKRRGCEIVGSEGTLVWLSEGKQPERCRVRLYEAQSGEWQDLFADEDLDANLPYETLMARFASLITGAEDDGLLDGRTAASELAVALAGKRAASDERVQHLRKSA